MISPCLHRLAVDVFYSVDAGLEAADGRATQGIHEEVDECEDALVMFEIVKSDGRTGTDSVEGTCSACSVASVGTRCAEVLCS